MHNRLDTFVESLAEYLKQASNSDCGCTRRVLSAVLMAKHAVDKEDRKALEAENKASEVLHDSYGSGE